MRKIAAVLAAYLVAPAACMAGAGDPSIQLVSPGTANSFVQIARVSDDGQHAFFMTWEPLLPADTDAALDVYDAVDGSVSLVSGGGAGAASDASFAGASADGSRVFFSSSQPFVSGDRDNGFDIYERTASGNVLISGGTRRNPAYVSGVSRDGSHVFFQTTEALSPDDQDGGRVDVYDASAGHIDLASGGGNAPYSATFRGASPDGSHVFFTTHESLDPADTDGGYEDVYQRAGGATTLVSSGGNGPYAAHFAGTSGDGRRVLFTTQESLVPGDADGGRQDVYERAGGQTTLVSAGGNRPYGAKFAGASPDCSRVFFQTGEPLSAADSDHGHQDVYERSGGQTTLISSGGNGPYDAKLAGLAAGGAAAFFLTGESLAAQDADGGSQDVYERTDGQTTLISGGGNAAADAQFLHASADASRVLFSTAEPLSPADTDSLGDIYESSPSGITLVTPRTPSSVAYGGASPDGLRVYFLAFDRLAPGDVDDDEDAYLALLPL